MLTHLAERSSILCALGVFYGHWRILEDASRMRGQEYQGRDKGEWQRVSNEECYAQVVGV
jgi:hypothetical protein